MCLSETFQKLFAKIDASCIGGDCMERKRRFQTRAQYAEEKAKASKFQKFDKNLNYLIGLVAVGIIATLIFILSQDSEPKNEAADDQEDIVASTEQNEQQTSQEEPNSSTNDDEQTDENNNIENGTNPSENEVATSTDPLVKEVQTNPDWPVYPTQQTGEHVSTFKKGDIDYEEKLKAIFSVTDLEQENAIVLRVGNNGSAKSAIAVVTSMDKEKKYRVSIEWLDGEGWKPTKLEVLNSLEGAY